MKPTFILTLLVFVTPTMFAQRIGGEWALMHRVYGEQEIGWFGASVAGPGDLDGDGVPDFVVGAPTEDSYDGTVYAFSGKTGAMLWEWTFGTGQTGWSVDGAGDVNGDGRPDVIVGAPDSAKVAVLLHDGTLWWSKDTRFSWFGGSVAGLGDIDLDGFDDVAVGAHSTNPQGKQDAGSLFVYSGLDGTRIYRFNGFFAGDRFGSPVAGAGDVDADGHPDILVGAPSAHRAGFIKVGEAYVFSGKDGSLLHEFTGQFSDEFEFGVPLSGVGDINLDGHDDFMISATRADYGEIDSGSVFLYSGKDGSLIFRIDGAYRGGHFGSSMDWVRDLNFDNIQDLVLGSTESPVDLGRVEIRSGLDGSLIHTLIGIEVNAGFGQAVANLGDIEGNGLDAIIAGLRAMENGDIDTAGAVEIYSPNPFLFADATELSVSSGQSIQIQMSFPDSEANTKYALLLSGAGTGPTTIAGLEVPLGQNLLLSQMLTGWAPFNLHGAFGTLDVNAQATATLDSDPTMAGLVGNTFYMAAVTYDIPPSIASGSNSYTGIGTALAGRRTSIAWPIRITQ
ncbi:MAG: hypothetical protein DWQ01_11315 [Planctomycetota bacterium]|nr:MAG: hypothetical protein DWQ01_11315 [Planctomycetota bacterium]